MLKKLFKHDFYALARTLFPTQIGVLAGGLAITLLLRLTLALSAANAQQSGAVVVNGVVVGVSVMGVVLIGLAIMASLLLTLMFVCMHFYNNMMGEQGYLTFTLPVSTGKLLWSKALSGLSWLCINGVVVFVSVLIVEVFGTAEKGLISNEMLGFIRECFNLLGRGAREGLDVWLLLPLGIVWLITSAASQLMELYFAMVVGGQIAKKNKLLAAIGMYLLINFVVGIVKKIFTFGSLGLGALQSISQQGIAAFSSAAASYMGINTAVAVLLFAGFFLWSRYLLSHDLNLQ